MIKKNTVKVNTSEQLLPKNYDYKAYYFLLYNTQSIWEKKASCGETYQQGPGAHDNLQNLQNTVKPVFHTQTHPFCTIMKRAP